MQFANCDSNAFINKNDDDDFINKNDDDDCNDDQ